MIHNKQLKADGKKITYCWYNTDKLGMEIWGIQNLLTFQILLYLHPKMQQMHWPFPVQFNHEIKEQELSLLSSAKTRSLEFHRLSHHALWANLYHSQQIWSVCASAQNLNKAKPFWFIYILGHSTVVAWLWNYYSQCELME